MTLFLKQTDCEAYRDKFENEDILTLNDFLKLSEFDLKDMGLKIGPKNRVLSFLEDLKSGNKEFRPKPIKIKPHSPKIVYSIQNSPVKATQLTEKYESKKPSFQPA